MADLRHHLPHQTPQHRFEFASDNTAGVCPEAWAAMAEANQGFVPSYGTDEWTQRACDLIRKEFRKPDAEIFFVFNGTAANSLVLASLCQSYHSVICHEIAHVETDECGAPEFFSNGTKILVGHGADGKLTPDEVERLVLKRTDVHYPKPRVVSLTQATESGTVYTPEEIAAITSVARRYGLSTHMDGARFANAYVTLRERENVSPADVTWRVGVDVLCLGGTKNGMNTTEAVVFFNPLLAREFEYRCKQAGQLSSKMRLQSAQWVGMLETGAWLKNAQHANAMAGLLAKGLEEISSVALARRPEANGVFVHFSKEVEVDLAERGWHFYNFIGAQGYRLMCSWATQREHVQAFLADLRECVRRRAQA
jgi:threonine aldolase